MGVYINFDCFVTGFKSWFKKNLNSCRKKRRRRRRRRRREKAVSSFSFFSRVGWRLTG